LTNKLLYATIYTNNKLVIQKRKKIMEDLPFAVTLLFVMFVFFSSAWIAEKFLFKTGIGKKILLWWDRV